MSTLADLHFWDRVQIPEWGTGVVVEINDDEDCCWVEMDDGSGQWPFTGEELEQLTIIKAPS